LFQVSVTRLSEIIKQMLDAGFWILDVYGSTSGGMQVIKHQATGIQYRAI